MAMRYGRDWRYRLITSIASVLLAPAIILERTVLGVAGHWGWCIPAAIRAIKIAKRTRPEVIFSSGGPVSAHLAGWLTHRLTGVPWITEIHDPIVEPPEPETCLVKLGAWRERRLRRILERLVCEQAALAWWFTERALHSARHRNPSLGTRGFRILPGSRQVGPDCPRQPCEHLRIGHFGILSDTRSLHEFLLGLSRFLAVRPEARTRIRIKVYGSALDSRARRFLQERELADLLEVVGRVEHDRSTGESGRAHVARMMQECDVLLLLHGHLPRCAEYIPSKIYEYFWARRLVFALVHMNEELSGLVRQYGGIVVPSTNPQAIAGGLEVLWSRWRDGQLSPASTAPISAWDSTGEIVARTRAALVHHRHRSSS
jgi:hypothetical protein